MPPHNFGVWGSFGGQACVVALSGPGWGALDERSVARFVLHHLSTQLDLVPVPPLIMIGQNIQGRHAELRAQSEYETNIKAEQEIEVILEHLEYQNSLLLLLIEKVDAGRAKPS